MTLTDERTFMPLEGAVTGETTWIGGSAALRRVSNGLLAVRRVRSMFVVEQAVGRVKFSNGLLRVRSMFAVVNQGVGRVKFYSALSDIILYPNSNRMAAELFYVRCSI